MDIRTQLGSPFDQHDQQDPITYLEALLTKYPSLSPLLKHSVVVELQCDICKVEMVSTKEQFVMSVRVPKDSKSLNMNDLIASSQQCALQDIHVCDKCNAPMKLCTKIVDAKQIIVLKLDVWNKVVGGAKMVRRNANITSVPNSSIKVGDNLFTLQSSVHLHSNKSASFSYISIVRSSGKWIHCNNQIISQECWPKGAKNLYLAFYEQTSLGGTKQRKSKPEVSHSKFTPLTTKSMPPSKRKLPETGKSDKGSCVKKTCISSSVVTCEDWGDITSVEWPVLRTEWRNYRYTFQ